MTIEAYNPGMSEAWDAFVEASKNGTFLFKRGYMDYHSERFEDCSYVFRDEKGRVAALFPASLHGDEVRSHGGLTYGGLLMDDKTHGAGEDSPMELLPMLAAALRERGAKTLLYKPVPHIYHRQPAEEDLYALWRMGAVPHGRNLASVLRLTDPIPSTKLNNRAVSYMRRYGLSCEATDKAADFWHIVVENRRSRYGAEPVHSLDEIQLLRDRFPDNIRFFVVKDPEGEVLSGFVVYLCNRVIHSQYPASSARGMALHAEDVGFHEIVNTHLGGCGFQWLDFGTSNGDGGHYLQDSLVLHKERYGARSVCYDTYLLAL